MNQRLISAVLMMALAGSGVGAQTADSKIAPDCKSPPTQKQMNDCAYEDFLSANAGYAESNQSVMDKLQGKPRDLFRRSQKAWIAYRTATCDFESSGLEGGSAQSMVRWQCAASMTRARVVKLTAVSNCQEGDLACVRLKE